MYSLLIRRMANGIHVEEKFNISDFLCFGFGFEGELKLQKKNECSNSFSSDHAEQLMSINISDFPCLFWICSFKRRMVIAEK